MGQAPCSEYRVASQRVISAWPASTMPCNASSCRSRSNVWPRTSPQACSRTMWVPPAVLGIAHSRWSNVIKLYQLTLLHYALSRPVFLTLRKRRYWPDAILFKAQKTQIMDKRTSLSYRSLTFFRRLDNIDYSSTIGLFGVQIIQISRVNRRNARFL
jgi:hypothetical protein